MSAVRVPAHFGRPDATSLTPPLPAHRGRYGVLRDRVVLRGGDGRLLVSEPGAASKTPQAEEDVPEAWFTEEDGLILPADFLAGDDAKR